MCLCGLAPAAKKNGASSTEAPRRKPSVVYLRNADVLRSPHTKALCGTPRKVEPGAHAVGDAPRSGVVDPDRNRPPVLRVGHRERRADRPGPRGGGVSVCVKVFAVRGTLSGRIRTRENFLACAISGTLHIFMNRTPACRMRRSGDKHADKQSDANMLHRLSPSMI